MVGVRGPQYDHWHPTGFWNAPCFQMLSKSCLHQVAVVEEVPGKTMAGAAAPGPVKWSSILFGYAVSFIAFGTDSCAVKNREQSRGCVRYTESVPS